MLFDSAAVKRRRVLTEIPPSLGERVRLWIHKLRHRRGGWFPGAGALKPVRVPVSKPRK